MLQIQKEDLAKQYLFEEHIKYLLGEAGHYDFFVHGVQYALSWSATC